MRTFLFVLLGLASTPQAWAQLHDVCETKYTIAHLSQSRCLDIERPLKTGSAETFRLHAAIITEDLALEKERPTVVLIPGGPGQPAEPLQTELQKKELINGMWKHLQVNVLLFDPRGTGRSTFARPTMEYDGSAISSENMVEDLKALVDAASPGRPVLLIAHSAGGNTALGFAERYPERVSKVLLVSAAAGARQMGELDIAQQSLHSYAWEEFAKTISDPVEREQLRVQYERVEDVLVQQTKARLLKTYVHEGLAKKKITVMDFRAALLERLEADPSGDRNRKLIRDYFNAYAEADEVGPVLVPDELRALKLKAADLFQYNMTPTVWIHRQIVCGEGISEEELSTPLIYDGLDMRFYCDGVHASAFRDPVLENIRVPVVFLSGAEDTNVPPYIARQIVARLPNARLIVEPGAGHNFFDKKPMVFYKTLESMLAAEPAVKLSAAR